MEPRCAFFEVRIELLNIIEMKLGLERVKTIFIAPLVDDVIVNY
jgi:hypothetical protein